MTLKFPNWSQTALILVALGIVVFASLAILVLLDSGGPAAPPVRSAPALAHAAKPAARVMAGAKSTPAPVPAANPVPDKLAIAFAAEQRLTTAERMKRWDAIVAEASKRFSVPVKWIRAVIMAESAGRTMSDAHRRIISTAGAMGLMQLMPSTYADMRAQHGLGADPYDPHDNVMAGTAYLHYLHGKYGYPAMFAAYNDGPGHLDERIANAGLLPTETIVYVERITGVLEGRAAHGMVRFTRPNGSPVLIEGGAVRSVRAALPGEYAPGVNSVITIGAVEQGVRENLATAKSIILSRGGAVRAKTRLVTRLVLSCGRDEESASASRDSARITCHRGL